MGPIFRLALHQLAGPRRLTLIFVLAALPVALSALVAAFADDDASFDRDYINTLLDGMLVAAILPIVTAALATAAFGNELEDRDTKLPGTEADIPRFHCVAEALGIDRYHRPAVDREWCRRHGSGLSVGRKARSPWVWQSCGVGRIHDDLYLGRPRELPGPRLRPRLRLPLGRAHQRIPRRRPVPQRARLHPGHPPRAR